MCSTVKTPRIHRSDLLKFVKRPVMTRVVYDNGISVPSLTLQSLDIAIRNYDFMEDPYVQELLLNDDIASQAAFNKVMIKKKTDSLAQLKSLALRMKEVEDQLGHGAGRWYFKSCVSKATRLSKLGEEHASVWTSVTTQEKKHVVKILSQLPLITNDDSQSFDVSEKFQELIQLLLDESTAERTLKAIVFARQRAVVAVLVELLSRHPSTKYMFLVGGFVGTSTNSYRKTLIGDLAEIRGQQEVLGDFRKGKRNIVVSTSVLEEGIDVPDCHLAICWDSPDNLVSFVQRRGRARQMDSKYVIFFPVSSKAAKEFTKQEDEMIKEYMAEREQIQCELEDEAAGKEEDSKEEDKVLRAEATG